MAWGMNNDSSGFGSGATNPLYTQGPTPTKGGGFSSWAGDLFGSLSTIGTAYFNSKAGYPTGQVGFTGGGYDYYGQPTRNPNTMLYIVGAIILIAVLYIFTRKS